MDTANLADRFRNIQELATLEIRVERKRGRKRAYEGVFRRLLYGSVRNDA